MQADVAKGVWRCPVADCLKQWDGLRSEMPEACSDLVDDEYHEEMSAAEIMAATGAKGLFDAGD